MMKMVNHEDVERKRELLKELEPYLKYDIQSDKEYIDENAPIEIHEKFKEYRNVLKRLCN